jgi:hypothetical protein
MSPRRIGTTQGRAVVIGAHWLHWMPDYISAEGLPFRLEPGWQRRARSSGGYDAVLGIQVHHTVSKTTPRRDMDYQWYNADTRPIGAILLDRTGMIHVGCAGATNTSGKGGPRHSSRGVIPLDSGNRNVIAIEAANDGVGEPWPTVQCENYVRLCAALVKGASRETPGVPLGAGDVHAHREWAPLRKVDTRGPSPWADGATEAWNMDAFRGAVFLTLLPPAPPPPPPPEDDVLSQDDINRIASAVIHFPLPDGQGNYGHAWTYSVDAWKRIQSLQGEVAELRAEVQRLGGE